MLSHTTAHLFIIHFRKQQKLQGCLALLVFTNKINEIGSTIICNFHWKNKVSLFYVLLSSYTKVFQLFQHLTQLLHCNNNLKTWNMVLKSYGVAIYMEPLKSWLTLCFSATGIFQNKIWSVFLICEFLPSWKWKG